MSENGSGGQGPLAIDAELETLFARVHERAAHARGRAALSLDDWVDLVEATRIMQALRESRGNRSAAARALGIGRRTLYTKMQKLSVQPAWAVGRPL